ncbi:MAG TPA: polysaccharide deacetylase family protein [bacterium]|nr:polysaccharide deacetylase family protein [bacterium]
MKTISFNIDVDPLINYYSIHGLGSHDTDPDPVYECGVKRFLELFDRYGIKATFFITAGGLNGKVAGILRKIVEKGHEIGNHSYSHDYRLTLMNDDEIFEEIKKNHEAIKELTGFECLGFRSPGYNSSEAIISSLRKMNYSYDSSLFPSFSYYLAKWLLINLKRLAGRRSRSVISSFLDAFGFYQPEFIDKNIKDVKKTGTLVEIPITTLFPPAGIPLIGTSLICFPKWLINLMLRNSLKRDIVNIEFHGIDLVEITDSTSLIPLKNIQPDLKYSLAHKIQRFEDVIKFYVENGYKFLTLSEIADLKKKG